MERAPYQQIAGEIRGRIDRGELQPGQPVPSARQITRDWGVALATATKVLATLRSEGLVRAVPGIGTVVASAAKPVQRGRRTREEGVVRVAMEIADREGLAEVSMRRIATELGVATMSLYRHVPGKDELMLLMMDAAMGERSLPDLAGDLRTDLTAVAHHHWEMFRAHPWLAAALSVSRPQLAPNGMRVTDRVLGRLRDAGLSLEDGMYVHVILFSYVRGIATALEPEVQAVRDSGMTADEYMETQREAFEAIAGTGMPHLAEMVRQDFDLDLDTLFEFGLTRLLDGIDAYVTGLLKPSGHRRRGAVA